MKNREKLRDPNICLGGFCMLCNKEQKNENSYNAFSFVSIAREEHDCFVPLSFLSPFFTWFTFAQKTKNKLHLVLIIFYSVTISIIIMMRWGKGFRVKYGLFFFHKQFNRKIDRKFFSSFDAWSCVVMDSTQKRNASQLFFKSRDIYSR